ncbi:MAG: precorrin-2 dehydrogenase/sirohydrochlorin ferrochelatase family protein [Candidatus Promineifilaceae bacterium]
MKPYPIFLVGLENRHCIVVGGTHEAEFKVRGLLDCDANITVISSEITEQMWCWAQEGRFFWIERDYQQGDLCGAHLVIAERTNSVTNAQIWAEAEAERALVTVLDDIPHCNAVAGSVIRQGPLAITISTSGAAPALAVRLRQRFQKEFGDEYATFLTWMQALRPAMKQHFPTFSQRKAVWYTVIDSDVLLLIRNGQEADARELLFDLTGLDPFDYLTQPKPIMA